MADGGGAAVESSPPRLTIPLPVLTPAAPPPLPSKAELGDLSTRTVAELKELCRKYGLTVSGRKDQLMARLYREKEPPGPPPVVRPRRHASRYKRSRVRRLAPWVAPSDFAVPAVSLGRSPPRFIRSQELPPLPPPEQRGESSDIVWMALPQLKSAALSSVLSSLGLPADGVVALKRRRLEIACMQMDDSPRKAACRAVAGTFLRERFESSAAYQAEKDAKAKRSLAISLRKLQYRTNEPGDSDSEDAQQVTSMICGWDSDDDEVQVPHAAMHDGMVKTALCVLRGTESKGGLGLDDVVFMGGRTLEVICSSVLRVLTAHAQLRTAPAADLLACNAALEEVARTHAAVSALLGEAFVVTFEESHNTYCERAIARSYRSLVLAYRLGRDVRLAPGGADLRTGPGVLAAAWTALALYAAEACADADAVRRIARDARKRGALRPPPSPMAPQELAKKLEDDELRRYGGVRPHLLPFPFEASRAKLDALLADAGGAPTAAPVASAEKA
jgi:hypothetical protein